MSLPHRFPDRDEIAAVRAEAETLEPQAAGAEYVLAGRVMGRRDMGKLVFLDLVDRSGQIQLLASLFHPDGPNDTAPREFNRPDPPAGLPESPMPARATATGFRWDDGSDG